MGETNRMWASASFVGVLIIIGLPLWWKTTEVYRVALPYDKIDSFDTSGDGWYIQTQLTVLANDDTTANEIVSYIEKEFRDSKVLKLDINKVIVSPSLRESMDALADEQEAIEEVSASFDLNKHNSFYVVQRKPLFQDVWLAAERIMFFRDAKGSKSVVETLKRVVYQTSVLEGATSESADTARQIRFPPGAGYHMVMSVVHPRPDLLNLELDAGEAVEDYIGSFVDELSLLHNFTLNSQWLHLLDFDFQSKLVHDSTEWGRHFSVRKDRLHLLLTKLEERTATHVSELPTINLVLYAVPCERAPLAIYDEHDKKVTSDVQAFLSPKWGGVLLYNPSIKDCDVGATWRPDTRVIMGTFISQLRKLLGINDVENVQGANIEPLRSVIPRKWEVDNLLRIRTLEQVTSAKRTLQSLAQLLGEISNIVINDEVGASINSAVDSIQRATDLMMQGLLLEAYGTSQSAFLAAETAFMEPSLLALLYFPDDQKYAIYIPLFLPIMFPVLLSLRHLLRWFRGKQSKEKND